MWKAGSRVVLWVCRGVSESKLPWFINSCTLASLVGNHQGFDVLFTALECLPYSHKTRGGMRRNWFVAIPSSSGKKSVSKCNCNFFYWVYLEVFFSFLFFFKEDHPPVDSNLPSEFWKAWSFRTNLKISVKMIIFGYNHAETKSIFWQLKHWLAEEFIIQR